MSPFRRKRRTREETAEPAAATPGAEPVAGVAFDARPLDAPPSDAPSLDAPTLDAPPFEAPSLDAPPLDAPAQRPPAELDALVGEPPGTRRRGRIRRRLRHLRRVREILLRDLGGLMFEMHRSDGSAGGPVLAGKLARLALVDAEIRDLEARLDDHRAMVVREPGIGGTCTECGELFGSEARYCWACGSPVAAGAGGAPDIAARSAHPQLAAPAESPPTAPLPPAEPAVDGTWVDHPTGPLAVEDQPTAEHRADEGQPTIEHHPDEAPHHADAPAAPPVPRMDPDALPPAAPVAADEPATDDVGQASGAMWSGDPLAAPPWKGQG